MSITNLSLFVPEEEIDPLVTRDEEYLAADAAHVAATHPHSQYLRQTDDVVYGATSSIDSQIAIFDGTSGKKIKSANASLDNQGNAFFNGVAIAKKGNNCFMLLSGGLAVGANTTGTHNTIIGSAGNFSTNTSGGYNVGSGITFGANTTGSQNSAFGVLCLWANTTGSNNSAEGMYALEFNTTGSNNSSFGVLSLRGNTTGSNNSAFGFGALNQSGLINCTGIGSGALVSANNQVQLGDSATTTFAYGAIQIRSDERDKGDIRPTIFGLKFILALKPKDFRWDMRDFYRTSMPAALLFEASDEEKLNYAAKFKAWEKKSKLANIIHDGSKKKTRYHHGLIAQDVAALITNTGEDFGGFQDHGRNGGDDVLSIGYEEFIGPLIKAIQELEEIIRKLTDRVNVLETLNS